MELFNKREINNPLSVHMQMATVRARERKFESNGKQQLFKRESNQSMINHVYRIQRKKSSDCCRLQQKFRC